jgi:CheY-like chemotaxis protein
MRNTGPASSGKGGKLLLVDDNRMGLAARRTVLEELGYTVAIASGGAGALELAASDDFDILITDWKMPKMDGVELIRQAREQGFEGPAILLSGCPEVNWVKAEDCGADVVIQKSANEITQLASHVKRFLNKKPTRKPPAKQTAGDIAAAKSVKPKSRIS